MSEVLNFLCLVDNCGRKFATKEKLVNYIKLQILLNQKIIIKLKTKFKKIKMKLKYHVINKKIKT